jgi:spore coat polysaccharide biosynthesis protein SpsF (cytidylyltransferase family)
MELINEKPMIYWQIGRINLAKRVNKLVVATSSDQTDSGFSEFLESENIEVYRGSLTNVHSRFFKIVEANSDFENIVRLTGDCPLVMPDLIDSIVSQLETNSFDYVSNTNPPTYPDGLDVEAFTRDAFLKMSELTLGTEDLEHVTLKFHKTQNLFKIGNLRNEVDLSDFRWTVDYPQDLALVTSIFESFQGREYDFNTEDVLNLLKFRPEISKQLPATLRNVTLKYRWDVAE